MKGKRWTDGEVAFLKENYHKKTVNEIAKELNKTKESIHSKAVRLKIIHGVQRKEYSEKEVAFLKDNYGQMSLKEISEELNRTKGSVQMKAQSLNLTKTRETIWTEKQIEFLKKNYKVFTLEELSFALGKTKKAINTRAYMLGITNKHELEEGDYKVCRTCLEELPITDFYSRKNKSTGITRLDNICKGCINSRRRSRNVEKRIKAENDEVKAWREEIAKQTYHCNKCGEDKTGDLMKIEVKRRKVTKQCKQCFNEYRKEYALKSISKMDFKIK